jgi:hypothetical protein
MARTNIRLWGPTPADSTAETVFTNTANRTTKLTEMTMASPAGAVAANVRLSIGTDGATTRVIEYPLPAGPQTVVINPGLVLTGTETLQLSCSGSDDVIITSGHGYHD